MGTNEFTLESMKHCFICLNQVSSHFPDDPKTDSDLQSFSIHSLESLSSYLKMDLGKVFDDNDSIPQRLLDKVRKAKLKGGLCKDCGVMNDKFSELYWKLVKIEMELVSCLQIFQSKLLAANEAGKSEGVRDLARSMITSNGDWTGKLDILEGLRAEAINKCSLKLNDHDTPRVKVQNLTRQQVIGERQKFQENASVIMIPQNSNNETEAAPAPDPEIEYRNVKTEDPNMEDPMPNEVEGSYYSDNSDNMDNSNAVEESSSSSVTPNRSKIEKFKRKKGHREDLNIKYSYEVVVPPEYRDVTKPRPSLSPASGKHKCNLCPSEFRNKQGFKYHYESVHLKVKYKCNICRKLFSKLCDYNRHHRSIHLGIRYKCLQCNKLFKQKGELTAHQRTHAQ